MDGVSELPVDVIHRILSFICYTADAVHTSGLSKTWLRAWSTNPRLNFRQCQFGEKLSGRKGIYEEEVGAEEFVKFVDTTLRRHMNHSPDIIKFELSIGVDDRKLASLVDKWLGLVVRNGVRKLSIYLDSAIPTFSFYTLPQSIFDSNSLISLKVRGSEKIDFCIGDDVVKKCCSLKKLHLEGVGISETTIRRLSSVFPLIEDLTLIDRYSLRNIEISNLPNLKNFYIRSDVKPNIEIRQPHCLESFTYKSYYYDRLAMQYINIFPCQHLTYLNLRACNITDMCFHKLISQCPVLEYLILDFCTKLERINVSSHSLMYLEISLGWELEDVKIDAPNLTELHYDTRVVPTFSSTSLFHDLEATVHIDCGAGIGTSFFIKLKELVTQISLSQISLTVPRECNNISFNIEEVRKVPLLDHKPKLEKLELEIFSISLITCTVLLDGLLWSFCPLNLTVSYRDYNPEPTKVLCKELMCRSQSCCSSREVKCWRHYLKQVEVVCYEESAGDKQMLSQQFDWKSFVDGSYTPFGYLKFRFSFHW